MVVDEQYARALRELEEARSSIVQMNARIAELEAEVVKERDTKDPEGDSDDWGNEYAAVVQFKRERDEARELFESIPLCADHVADRGVHAEGVCVECNELDQYAEVEKLRALLRRWKELADQGDPPNGCWEDGLTGERMWKADIPHELYFETEDHLRAAEKGEA